MENPSYLSYNKYRFADVTEKSRKKPADTAGKAVFTYENRI